MKNILFVCTGNSARSIMAEAYMNTAGAGAWRAFSAGSTPVGAVNPFALETLARHDVKPPREARSKSWNEFTRPGAPVMNIIVTVCDNAAGETCPVWPSGDGAPPRMLHWSFPDPAAATGGDDAKRDAFAAVFADIRTRIDQFLESSEAS